MLLLGRQMRRHDMLVAHDAETSAGQVVCLLRDSVPVRHLARNARRLMEEKHTWERSVALLEGVYCLAVEGSLDTQQQRE